MKYALIFFSVDSNFQSPEQQVEVQFGGIDLTHYIN